jgi:hypothetical protein
MNRLLREPKAIPLVVECAIGDMPFQGEAHAIEHGYRYIGVRNRSPIWAKENLINVAVHSKLCCEPWKYLAWVDGDIVFDNENWVHDTILKLQTNDVVQMFQTAVDLGACDQFMAKYDGIVWRVRRDYAGIIGGGSGGCHLPVRDGRTGRRGGGGSKKDPYTSDELVTGHPGYAWACTRTGWDVMGGLMDFAILGSADRHMAFSFFQVAEHSLHPDLHPNYKAMVLAFQERCKPLIGKVGYVCGNICHYFHGAKAKRQYGSRWRIILEHEFNPVSDIRTNGFGVIEFQSSKPMLAMAVATYFALRDEDCTAE